MNERFRLPRGRQVYDAFNGARVGAIVGAIAGTIPAALVAPAWVAAIPVLAVAGALIGYRWERRRIRQELSDEGPEGR